MVQTYGSFWQVRLKRLSCDRSRQVVERSSLSTCIFLGRRWASHQRHEISADALKRHEICHTVLQRRRPPLIGHSSSQTNRASLCTILPYSLQSPFILTTPSRSTEPTPWTYLFHSPTLQLLFSLQEGPLVFVEERTSLHSLWSWPLACPKQQRHPACFIHSRRRRNGRRHPDSPAVPSSPLPPYLLSVAYHMLVGDVLLHVTTPSLPSSARFPG